MKTARRTQQERSSATTKDLVAAARTHFARDGYTGASLDAVCADAGITKGALYHHFKGKQHLFRAVYEAEQQRLRAEITAAFRRCPDDPWAGMYEGARAFLTGNTEPATQRITLLDAPGALGWAVLREVQADCRELVHRGLALALGDDPPPPAALDALTSMLYGAQCEAAMAVAHADDPDELLAASLAQFRRLLDAVGSSR
jgi:AcrR family transcriptional regulator